MMAPRSAAAMARPRPASTAPQGARDRARVRARNAAGALAGLSLLGVAPTLPLRAAPPEAAYPSTDLFRRLQLDVLDCGRDNTTSSCEAARRTADPLMDHPRLPASCKDVLWTIREKAVVAPANSFNRREQLNKAAADLMPVCRERDVVKPVVKPDDRKGPSIKF